MTLALLMIVGIILILAGFVYFTIILPTFLMVDCSNSQVKHKSTWVVVMLILWPISGIVYGLFHAQKKWLRISCWMSILSLVLLLIAITQGIQYFKSEAMAEESLLKTQLSSNAPLNGLPDDIRLEIEKDLQVTYTELRERSWLLNFEGQAENIRFIKKLNTLIQGGSLNPAQAKEWLENYRSKKAKK